MSIASSTDFESLLDRVRLGDEDAAWQLVGEYGPHIMAVVRRKLSRQIRVRLDSQDLAQAVWKSFFLDIANTTDVRSPDELIRLLIGVTQNKVTDAYRQHLYSPHRGAAQEQPMVLDDGEAGRMARDNGTPSQFAIARERWQHMVADASPTAQEVLRRRMMGETYEAIGASLGMSARSAKRCVVDLWQAD